METVKNKKYNERETLILEFYLWISVIAISYIFVKLIS